MSFIEKHSIKLAFAATAAGVLIFKYFIFKHQNDKRRKYVIIQSVEDWEAHEKEILNELYSSDVIGMDCEWVTDGNRKPISLLQLANSKGFCVLIRLSRIPVWLIPSGLSELLKDRNILKVGVGVNDDANKLFHDYCLEVFGLIDLRYLANDLHVLQGKSLGLKSLAKELLNYNMNKSYTLRCSNWDAESLTSDQIIYAADDAVISAKLFDNIKSRKNGWFNIRSWYNEDIELYIDMPFKQTFNNNVISKSVSGMPAASYKSRYSVPRQKPMYDNCQLLAPDGELLCICERRKAEWYVYKGLGESVSEEPYTVRLNFEPSGRPRLDDIFYTKEKVNICVVCGKSENYHRKFVVPSEYRKYFPDLMKKNLSHDVLLLCVDCHKKSNLLDQKMRVKLAELCDAPLVNGKYAKYKFDSEMAHVKSAARALASSGHKIPKARKTELEKTITDYFNVSQVTEELLQKALNFDLNTLNESYTPHGLKVYQYFCKNGGLINFEKLWRQHFLDTMKPKYLPNMWSVEHNHRRLALRIINQEREIDFDVSILGLDSDLMREVENLEY